MNKTTTTILILFIAFIFIFANASFVLAQDTVPPQLKKTTPPPETPTQKASLDNPLGTESIPSIMGKIIKTFLGIIGTISLVMFIYGGLLMLTSAGKSGQIQKGQQTLVWASLGILVVFASYAILRFIFSAFGL